ncbi:MAG: hypothetical protein H2212_12790 [Ruminococcus sp.]|nr:hypothetical protein [Ruminococcus sp.]
MFRDTLLILWLLIAVLFFLLFFGVQGGFSILKAGQFKKLFLEGVLPALVLSGLFMGISVFAVYPLWNYLSDLQRLCRMIYTYPLYLVRNYIESGGAVDTGQVQVVREIEYFPHFYYRVHRGNVEITVELDGSKFHQDGSFEDLTKVLEDRYTLNVIDITQRREYLTYHLFRDAEQNRLNLEDIAPNGYTIPLMKGVAWEINKIPHALIVGVTGGGKTVMLNILIQAFLLMGATLYICDPKNSALADYGRIIPNVRSEIDGIQDNIAECVETMGERYKEMKGKPGYISGQDFTHYNMKPVVLIMDEYAAYASTLDRKELGEFKTNLSQIVFKGREAGVFTVLATQRPDAVYLDGSVRDQLGLRITLGKMSDEGYRMVFGNTQQKLKKSYGGAGKGYMDMDGKAFIQKFCAALVPKGYRFIDEAEKICRHANEGREEENIEYCNN